MSLPSPRRRSGAIACIVASTSALMACASHAAAPDKGGSVGAIWQHHETTINYYGLTARYSCDSFEDKVRMLLRYLGARPDLKVQMDGCNRAVNRPGRLSAVRADFYTLAPAGVRATGAVNGTWEHVTVKPMAPIWMGYGECELLRQLQPVVTAYFTSRHLDYHAACVPYDATVADYELTGDFLMSPASR
jgi:hypothetical protein